MSEEIVQNLKQAVIEGDEEKVSGYAQKAIEIGYDLSEAFKK